MQPRESFHIKYVRSSAADSRAAVLAASRLGDMICSIDGPPGRPAITLASKRSVIEVTFRYQETSKEIAS